jgi:hypothetical protein
MIKLRERPSVNSRALHGTVVQLRIDVRHVRPPIWRRLLVPGDIMLDRLHDVFQVAMGWNDSHRHAFRRERCESALVDPDAWDPPYHLLTPVFDHLDCGLSALATEPGDRFQYDYNFHEGWMHDIRLEVITPAAEPLTAARCLAGRRACPPEDCGGLAGYTAILAALAAAEHPDHPTLLERVAGYDPAHFDLVATNARLSAVKVT